MIYEQRYGMKGQSLQRLRPRQDDTSGIPPSPSSEEQPSQSTPSDPSATPPEVPVQPSPTDPPSNTSPPPNSDPTSPPDAGSSSGTSGGTGGGSTQPNPTPTNSNTGGGGQLPTNSGGGGGGGQNSASSPPNPTGVGSAPPNDAEGSLVTTNGQTLSIAGGVTVAVSQIITEHNGQITTVTVPIATLTPTVGLTASQRDGIIAGSVVGGFVIGMVVIGLFFYRRRRRIREQEQIVSEVIPRPRRLLHSDGPLDLAGGSPTNPYMTTAWTSQPQMAQYDTPVSGSPFPMGEPISSPRLSRARTSVSGSIFQEDVWPPPGEEYLGTLAGGNPFGANPVPPSRTSLDTGPGDSPSPARPFVPYDAANASPQQPPSAFPILTHGIRPSTPTSLVSSPTSYASGSRLIPSAAAAAKARESTSESNRGRYRGSWFGPNSGPHSAYSESEYGPGGGVGGAGGGHGGGGGSSTMSQVDQAESSPASPPLIDLNSTSASRTGTGSSGTTSDRGVFNEAINARLNPMGLGGGPSPGPTPLENEIPPLYSMIRRDTDLSLSGAVPAPERST